MATGIALFLVFASLAGIGWLVGGGARVEGSGVVLRYSRFFRAVGVVGAILMPIIFATVVLIGQQMGFDDPGRTYGLLGMGGAFFILALYPMVEGFGRRFLLDNSGITMRSWTGRVISIPWDKVERVSDEERWRYFEVRGAGKRIRLNYYIGELELLGEACREYLHDSIYNGAFDKFKRVD